MTSYTQADLDAVERAIAALSDPLARPVRIRYAGGTEVEYTPQSVGDLLKIKQDIAAALARASTAGRRMTSVARFSRGF